MDDFSLARPAGHLIMGDGSGPDGLAKKDGAKALSRAASVDTATTQVDKSSRTKNLITEYDQRYPDTLTRTGKPRQRRAGGGAKGVLQRFEDKLLFILVYQKTNPPQTMHALQFHMSQPQANYWIHQLLPVLQQALAALGHAPERDASRLATSPLALEGAPATAIDGTERRRQRPTDARLPQEHYSGKKQTHTDKNLLLGTLEKLGGPEAR